MTAITSELFRNILGHLPTGVTVITAHGTSGPVGMSANSVTALSLEPPMILVCPAKSSTTWPQIREAGSFCVNVMADHHEAVTRRFALRGIKRFTGVSITDRVTGPALSDAVAWIECRLREEHDGGDHTIAVADVLDIEASPNAAPLIFFRGCYGRVLMPADAVRRVPSRSSRPPDNSPVSTSHDGPQ